VENTLLHFAGKRYAIWSWVVMPSHFHWVFEPLQGWVESVGEAMDQRTPRQRIMHSVKRHSARQCNRLRNESGTFWQDEAYDHCVEDIHELERIIDYVEMNPVRAGIALSSDAYRFSSAFYRQQHAIPFGRPLIGESRI
jgi:type I restriction enzyme R subunit